MLLKTKGMCTPLFVYVQNYTHIVAVMSSLLLSRSTFTCVILQMPPQPHLNVSQRGSHAQTCWFSLWEHSNHARWLIIDAINPSNCCHWGRQTVRRSWNSNRHWLEMASLLEDYCTWLSTESNSRGLSLGAEDVCTFDRIWIMEDTIWIEVCSPVGPCLLMCAITCCSPGLGDSSHDLLWGHAWSPVGLSCGQPAQHYNLWYNCALYWGLGQ